MRKRALQKTAVLTICLMFLGPFASGLLAADTGTPQTPDPTMVLKAPSQFLLSLFPYLLDLLSNNKTSQTQTTTDGTTITIKTTADITVLRVSGRD